MFRPMHDRGFDTAPEWPIRARMRVVWVLSICMASVVMSPEAVGTDRGRDEAPAQLTAGAHDPAAGYVIALVEETVPQLLATPDAQRSNQLRRLFDEHIDLLGIARFAMGRYWRLTGDEERAEFVRLFRELLVQTSNASLADYRSERLRVTETRPAEDNEVLVRSALSLNDGPHVQIDWRLRRDAERFRIQDVIVEGISVRIALRDLFAIMIQEKGGTMATLLSAMRELVPSPPRDAR